MEKWICDEVVHLADIHVLRYFYSLEVSSLARETKEKEKQWHMCQAEGLIVAVYHIRGDAFSSENISYVYDEIQNNLCFV